MKNNFSCEKCQDILFDYASDLLDKKSSAAVLTHISTCSDCKKKFDDINAMLNVMQSAEIFELPDNFDRVLHMNLVNTSEVMKEHSTEPWWRRFVLNRHWKSITSAALAFVLVVSVTSTGLYQHFKNESGEFNMSEDENGYIKTEISSPAITAVPDFEAEIIQNEAETASESRIINGAQQNNKAEDAENNEYISPENKVNNFAQNDVTGHDKNDRPQSGGVQTDAPDVSVQNEDNVKDNNQQDNINSASEPSAQADEEFMGGTYSIPKPASIEDAAEPPLKDTQETATSGAGGGNSPRMVDTSCSVTVDDVNSFLIGYGFSPLNEGATRTTITISESEFENFMSYAKKTGAAISVDVEGNSGIVYITISE